jgi:DNA-binding response OmpR family regulator
MPWIRREADEPKGTAARVLLVEPEPQVRAVIAEALADAAFAVVSDTGAALRAAMDDPAAPPVVLVAPADPPEGCPDGLALAAEARRRCPHLYVVYVTGRPPSRLDGHVLGACERFVPRPVAPGALVDAVRGLLLAAPARRRAD